MSDTDSTVADDDTTSGADSTSEHTDTHIDYPTPAGFVHAPDRGVSGDPARFGEQIQATANGSKTEIRRGDRLQVAIECYDVDVDDSYRCLGALLVLAVGSDTDEDGTRTDYYAVPATESEDARLHDLDTGSIDTVYRIGSHGDVLERAVVSSAPTMDPETGELDTVYRASSHGSFPAGLLECRRLEQSHRHARLDPAIVPDDPFRAGF